MSNVSNRALVAAAVGAAKMIERERTQFHSYSCDALYQNLRRRRNVTMSDALLAQDRYAAFFGLDKGRVWFGLVPDETSQNERVLALCLFAAAVEAGDA